MTQSHEFDHEVDVLVVGSGNGALTAAICSHDMAKANVLVIEKGDKFGGTSALSGGGVWVPNNRYAKAAGAADSYAEAMTYLQHTIPKEMVKSSMLETYLKIAPEMIDYLHKNTRLRYESLEKYPDYFTDLPGAKAGHRSMEPEPVYFSELESEDLRNLLDGSIMMIFGIMSITQVEAQVLMTRLKGWKRMLIRLLFNYFKDIRWLLKGKRYSRRATGGVAGIVRLFLSLRDRKIPLWLNTEFKELIVENKQVIGAVVFKQGKKLRIKANKAVILAAGGFEQNQEMREQYLPKPSNTKWSAGCKTNTGDAIRAAIDIGADTALMDNAWWCTTKVMPGQKYPIVAIVSKSLPGTMVVNKSGHRFSNESQNYMTFIKETFAAHTEEEPCVPMYMIFDENFRKKRNAIPTMIPKFLIPEYFYKSGFFAVGNTPEELANSMGIDSDGFKATLEKFNGYAQTGKDLDFQRGDSAYDQYYGDPEFKPNPCLAKIERPPFYAVRLDAGDFGTQGGMVITEDAQVCDRKGQVIEGLYACGNCSAAVLPTYPGPGSTLGPAMTFAYQAAKHLAKNR